MQHPALFDSSSIFCEYMTSTAEMAHKPKMWALTS